MKTWPTLYYTNNSGKTYEWKVWADNDSIYTEYGGVGDKKQVSEKRATPKNVGRSNGTTAEEQAVLEAEALWVYNRDRKYSETLEGAQITDKLRPMLAKKLGKLKDEMFPVHVQPKLDGVRCLIQVDGDEVEMVSRSGKPIENCDHIAAQLREMNLPPTVIDGELYLHGATFQQITKLVKKYRPGESETIDFAYYDSYTKATKDLPWGTRHQFNEESLNVYSLYSTIAEDLDQIHYAHQDALNKGFEGSIIRISNGLKDKDMAYKPGGRSSSLLKLKDFLDAEYKIVGYTDGIGKFEGCVIYECETEDGSTFSVVPKGTMEERRDWYNNADSDIGKLLTVRFFERTEDNIPRFPVGVGVRWENDL
ncbi:MAG: hypothetical protein LC650_02670 [Actinobacteria bacterium]|nr:hypothetical protein [Actinomycetota bacterium]